MFIEPFLIFISTIISLNNTSEVKSKLPESKTEISQTVPNNANKTCLPRGGWDGN